MITYYNNIIYQYFFQTVYFLLPLSISSNLTHSNRSSIVFDGSLTDVVDSIIVGKIIMDIVRKQKWIMNLALGYDCRSLLYNSPDKTFCKLNYKLINFLPF